MNYRLGSRQQGVTLVELMVSIAVGIVLVAGLAVYFAGQKKTYSYQDALIGLQDSARTAFIIIGRDLRLAGYYGCVPQGGQVTAAANASQNVRPPAGAFSQNIRDIIAVQQDKPQLPVGFELAVMGQDAADSDGLGELSDRLVINIAQPLNLPIAQMANSLDNVVLRDPNGTAAAALVNAEIDQGSAVAVADCQQATVFQVSNNVPNDGGITLKHERLVNPSDSIDLQHIYGSDKAGPAELLQLRRVRYYIREVSGSFSLYRCEGYPMTGNGGDTYCAGDPQDIGMDELVTNVDSMQIEYGVASDCNAAGTANYVYSSALATDPERAANAAARTAALNQTARAIAVKITLTLSAPEIRRDNFADEAADRGEVYRQEYSTVVELRNGCRAGVSAP